MSYVCFFTLQSFTSDFDAYGQKGSDTVGIYIRESMRQTSLLFFGRLDIFPSG